MFIQKQDKAEYTYISSSWNYKVLSDIFVKIELFTYSYSVTTY